MRVKFLTKTDGTVSKMNLVQLLVFVLGVVEIVRPFIPAEYLPLIIVGVAVVNLYLRTYTSDVPVHK